MIGGLSGAGSGGLVDFLQAEWTVASGKAGLGWWMETCCHSRLEGGEGLVGDEGVRG